jgi:predicted NodU family carbamoyl transferase
MVVLGISGPERDAASALLIDGALVAATTEEACIRTPHAGYAYAAGFPFASVQACLQRAGITARDVQRMVFCDEDGHTGICDAPPSWMAPLRRPSNGTVEFNGVAGMRVGRLFAHASQLQATSAADGPIVVLDTERRGHAAVFIRTGRAVVFEREIDHFSRVVQQLNTATAALGLGGDPLMELELLAGDGQPLYAEALGRALWYEPGGGIGIDRRELEAVYADAKVDADNHLADRAPLHMQVRRTRVNLAASVVTLVGRIVCDIAADIVETYGSDTFGLGGSLFAHHEIAACVRGSLGHRAQLALLPSSLGLALGAAIAGGHGASITLPVGLAVGPQFSESDVKEALDIAHLDYVYEPQWDRIMNRATGLLACGKRIGWFQGAMDFGRRSLGARSVLCDPSGRYARENLNWFLRHPAEASAPPLVMTNDAARECLEHVVCSSFGLVSAVVKPEFRPRLQAAIDQRGRCRVQTIPDDSSSRVRDLLRVHRQRTDVPALLQIDLCGPDEPVACTPRDALRTTYSSPLDALFIERFVLMKDYWLLRSDIRESAVTR